MLFGSLVFIKDYLKLCIEPLNCEPADLSKNPFMPKLSDYCELTYPQSYGPKNFKKQASLIPSSN